MSVRLRPSYGLNHLAFLFALPVSAMTFHSGTNDNLILTNNCCNNVLRFDTPVSPEWPCHFRMGGKLFCAMITAVLQRDHLSINAMDAWVGYVIIFPWEVEFSFLVPCFPLSINPWIGYNEDTIQRHSKYDHHQSSGKAGNGC